jgi:2-polyprenyl-3-methyl-5-hydroxy-6-metoxy-1,4-benzoquinol methylase
MRPPPEGNRVSADRQEQAPIALQQSFWDKWNAEQRETRIGEVSSDQKKVVLAWLAGIARTDLDIIDVGCGAGWLDPSLKQFGAVTATDLSADVLARLRTRVPHVEFIAGDFMELPFEPSSFDVAVSLEVLAHVADQPAFLGKIHSLLRPRGWLMLATQNRSVLERHNMNSIQPAAPGNLRRWTDMRELRALIEPQFEIVEMFTKTPRASQGPLRLINARPVRQAMRALVGESFERMKERLGLGWTLMCLAQKR